MTVAQKCLRICLAYVATLMLCTAVYFLFATGTQLFAIDPAAAVFVLVFTFFSAAAFSVIPFILCRAALAFFERRSVQDFAIGGAVTGLCVGAVLWSTYGFTYVGESAWPRMARWVLACGAAGGLAGMVQWWGERALARRGARLAVNGE